MDHLRVRYALLTTLAALAACDPAPEAPPPSPPPALSAAAAASISGLRRYTPAEQCERASQEEFRRGWKSAATGAADEGRSADYSSHYNAGLDRCFLLVTIRRDAPPGAAALVARLLIDVRESELLGEYLGQAVTGSPPALPARCRVAELYCGSGDEWQVLVRRYVEG